MINLLRNNIKTFIVVIASFLGTFFLVLFLYRNLDNIKNLNFNLNRLTILFDFIVYFIAIFFFYKKTSNKNIKNFFDKFKKLFKRKNYVHIIISLTLIFLGMYYFDLSQQGFNKNLFYPRTIYGFIKYVALILEKIPFIYGFLLSLTYLLSYRLLRFSLNRYFAITASILFVTSEIHLYNLIPSIERDYFKVIIILLISLSLIFIFRTNNLKKKYFIYYLLAILVGIGLTVRNDILIYIIPIYISFFFTLKKPFMFSIKFIIITFLIFLMVPDRGGGISGTLGASMAIVLFTGLMNNFDFLLGQSNSYYISNISEQPFIEYYLSIINVNYILVYIKYVFTFFFDFILKIILSANHILNLFYIYSDKPLMFEYNFFKIYEFKKIILNLFIGYGSIFFLMSIIILKNKIYTVKNYYLVIFYILFLFLIPVIYFYTRHYFYLEIISIWSFFFLIQNILTILINEFKKRI